MSRTSKALKRLGVAGIAVATIGAGVPALVASSALANHTVTGVSLSPDADSAPVGTCNQFTASVTLSNSTDTATVDVLADPRTNEDVEFCVLSADGKTSTAPAFGDGNVNETAEFPVTEPASSSTKTVTFGIIGDRAGVIDVTAFIEGATGTTGTENNAPDGNEPRDTSVKTFTAGGAAAATAVDAEPETGAQAQGANYTFTAKVTNSGGEPLPGVTPNFDVISGPDAAVGPTACSATDQTGTANCTLVGGGNTPGTDTIRVYVNKTDADNNPATADTAGADAGEPFDDITVTYSAPQAAGTTVALTCASVRTTAAGNNCENPLSETSEVFTALVRNSGGTGLSGVPVNFTFTRTGPAPDDNDGTATAPAQESIAPLTCTTGSDGTCTTTLTNPRTVQDETFVVQARVAVSSGAGAGCAPADANSVCASATKIFRNAVATESRNLNVTPESQNASLPGVAPLKATVTDRLGVGVRNVQVTFTESGPGRFTNGSSTFVGFTGADGSLTAELQTVTGDTAGANTVTATITGYDLNANGTIDGGAEARGAGTADDECEQAAGTTQRPGGNAPGQVAGDCDDTGTVNFSAASPTPSATPTSTTSPAPGCTTAQQNLPVRVNTPTINATGLASVTVTGATPNGQIELQGYSQNHFMTANFNNDPTPIDRTVTAGSDGSATINDLRPASNTRLRARVKGCAFGTNALGSVINVRTQLTLIVNKTGLRKYTISGKSIPARPGGLIVNIYCDQCSNPGPLIAQPRANPTTGEYTYSITFPSRLQNQRVNLQARTGQDAQNAPGASNVRRLLVF